MELEKKITTVIIHYQTPELLQKSVQSFNAFYPDVPLIVVDNGSEKESIEAVEEWIYSEPNTKWVGLKENRFHGPVMDYAAREVVESEYMFFLDSDTETLEGGFLEEILHIASQDPTCYGVGMFNRVNKRGFSTDDQRAEIILQTPYMFINRQQYLSLPPFIHHGQPTLANFRKSWENGWCLKEYPMDKKIDHLWRGTARKTGYGLGWRGKMEYLLNKIGL